MNAATETPPAPGSGAMFDGIARRYDLLNRIMSMGIDRGWRRRAVRSLGLKPGETLLDLATGTADVALMATRMTGCDVVGLDPSANMLAVGEQKVQQAGLNERVKLVQGDAQALPYPDRSFEGISIAFGIRNVPDRAKALREMARVLKPGRKAAILELSEPRSGLLGAAARFHVHHVVPRLGALLSGAKEYRYLQASIARFPPPEEFSQTIRESGFARVEAIPLTFGTCCLFVATVGDGP